MDEPLAHSPRGDAPPQTYRAHADNVREQAVRNARDAAAFYTGDHDAFVEAVQTAAIYHDLGKLDEANQEVLCRESRERLPLAHEDAGVAQMIRLGWQESVVLVAAHHGGLFSREEESGKHSRPFRNLAVANHVDDRLDQYLSVHRRAGCPTVDKTQDSPLQQGCGFTRRIALSCLVDADHGDTASHYGKETALDVPKSRWAERLDALDRYVAELPRGKTEAERRRNALRRCMYEACRHADIGPAIRACDAPVGSGKTTAVMAHLLRVAHSRNLRHIFVVLPYTNIITQAVKVYRKALVLPGERPDEIVAEHHHQADFGDLELRQLATLWKAPFIVTTAVQFFETLASAYPARLRKLHELPGSAVFIDETHASMPSCLWPQMWRWLETCTNEWGSHLVLASGSLPRFWELQEFVDPPKQPTEVPDLVPERLRLELEAAEGRRISPRRRKEPFRCDELIQWVTNHPGPRLVILNTVQSTAVVADRMRKAGHDVLHLSTALAPIHRDRIVKRIKERLKYGVQDWTLVATSCVEAGMNFSFRTGFRESCSTASLIQIGGRVSRGAEHENASVWDFRTLDELLKDHPGFQVSRRVLDHLFDQGLIGGEHGCPPSQLAKEAMRQEVTDRAERRARDIRKAESEMEYREVAKLCRIIDADTHTVVIDPDVADALRGGEKVSPICLVRHSVQMWANRIKRLAVEPLFPFPDDQDGTSLYVWTGAYDPDFLGYMEGVLPLVYHKWKSFVI